MFRLEAAGVLKVLTRDLANDQAKTNLNMRLIIGRTGIHLMVTIIV